MARSGRPGRISHTHPRRFRGLLGAHDFGLRPAEEKFTQRTAQVATDAESRGRKQKQRDQSSHSAVQKHIGSIHQGELNGFGAPSSLPRTEQMRDSRPKFIVTPSMRRSVDVKAHFRFLLSLGLFPFSQAASVAIVPSALFCERYSLAARRVFSF